MANWTAKKIRELREKFGETQEVFCRRFRISPTAYRNWEQDRFAPSGPAQEVLDRLLEDFEEGKIRELQGV